MAQYLTPGVYIEEIPGAKPIEGVGTATGAFVGIAEKGPIGKAELITNWTQFVNKFGGYIANGYLAYAVNQFFMEGGTKCYVVRTCHYEKITDRSSTMSELATKTLKDRSDPDPDKGKETLKIEALSEGSWGDQVAVIISPTNDESDPAKYKTDKFDLTVLYDGSEVEIYKELGMADLEGRINDVSKHIKVIDLKSSSTAPDNMPKLSVVDFKDEAPLPTLGVVALMNGLSLSVTDGSVVDTFKLTVSQSGSDLKEYDLLTIENIEKTINVDPKYIWVVNLNSSSMAPLNRPAIKTGQLLPPSVLELKDRAEPLPTLGVIALKDGLSLSVDNGSDVDTFKLTVSQSGTTLKVHDNLTIENVASNINGISPNIGVVNLNSSTQGSRNRPVITATNQLSSPNILKLNDRGNPQKETLGVIALMNGLSLSVTDGSVVDTFKLTVSQSGSTLKVHDNLTIENVASNINVDPKYIWVVNLESSSMAPLNRPAIITVQLLSSSALELKDRAEPLPTLGVIALKDGLSLSVDNGSDVDTFKLTVSQSGITLKVHENLTIENVASNINGISPNIGVVNLNSSTQGSRNRPALSPNPVSLPSSSALELKDRSEPLPKLPVTALAKGLTLQVAHISETTFELKVLQCKAEVKTFTNLKIDDIKRKINGVSKYISVEEFVSDTAVPVNRPSITSAEELPFFALAGGWDGIKGIPLLDNTGKESLTVSAWRENVTIKIDKATLDSANKFKITVKAGKTTELFDELTMANVEQEINEKSTLIEVDVKGVNPPDVLKEQPVTVGLEDYDFIGDEAAQNGLHAFDVIDDINILAIPDWPGDREVIVAAAAYCKNRKDCFFVADPPMGLTPQVAQQFKEGTGEKYAGNAFNSSYAPLYYPWIYVSDPLTGKTKLVPPSGAVVGTYSYTDVARGVHKAPAGISEGYLDSAVGIEYQVTKGEQELLNPIGVNVIRSFPGSGIVIWGARTLSADSEWKYVNVRRLLLFIEESIDQGSQWVVFEPNDRTLRASVKRDVTAFLTTVWRSGALFGSTAQEAFFVKIDDENNPPESRDLGRLIIDVGVAPVKPAEFVIFRISQITQGTKS